jgi:hypothetical protein
MIDEDRRTLVWRERHARWSAAAAIAAECESVPEAWERLVAQGLLPREWLGDPARSFGSVVLCPGCDGEGSVVLESSNSGPGDYDEIRGACPGCIATGRYCRITPAPSSRWVIVALAADPAAALAAESLARSFAVGYQRWLASAGKGAVFPGNAQLERLCWADDWIFANCDDLRYIGSTPDYGFELARRSALRALCGFVRGDSDRNGLAATDRVVTGFEALRGRAIRRYSRSEVSPDNAAAPLLEILALGYAFTGADRGHGVLTPRPPRAWIASVDPRAPRR